MQRTNFRGVALIKSHEKCVLRAYQDPHGVWTIGWGHTGPDVKEGDWWSQEMADSILLDDLANAERAVDSYVIKPLNENQFAALVSFTFNEGAGELYTSSILTLLNQGDYVTACDHFALFNKMTVNGVKVVSKELTGRRTEEQALFRLPVAS